MKDVQLGKPIHPDYIEFRLELAGASGRPHDAIVCEGVVVATKRDGGWVDED